MALTMLTRVLTKFVDTYNGVAGFVSRGLDTWLGERLSITDFGANPANASNTAAIQSALNSGKKRLFVPAGVYVTGALTVPDDVTLYGEGATSVFKFMNTGGATAVTMNDYSAVHSLTLDVSDASNTAPATTQALGKQGVIIKDVTAKGAKGHTFVFNDTGVSAVKKYNRVQGCTVVGAAGAGVYLYNAHEVRIVDNDLTNCGDGVTGQGNVRVNGNIYVTGNHVHNNAGNGIVFGLMTEAADQQAYAHVHITDNIVVQNGMNGIACQADLSVVEHNTVRGNGTQIYHQGVLVNANGVSVTSNIITDNAGVGIDFGDCRKCSATANLIEGNGWLGIEVNSCEQTTVTGNVLNLNFSGKAPADLQAGILLHKGNGGYPFPGDNNNNTVSGNTIRSGDGQQYAILVADTGSYDNVIVGNTCKTAGYADDIVSRSPDIRASCNITRWDPLGLARATLTGGVVSIPSIADVVQVNGSGSIGTINIDNGGAFVKDRTVRIKSVNGCVVESSGGSGGNIFLGGTPVTLTAGQSILLYSDGSGGWVKYNAPSSSAGGVINGVAVFGDSTVDGYGTAPWIQNPLTANHFHNTESPMAWVSMLDTLVGKRVFNNGYSGKSIIDDWAISNISTFVFNNATNTNLKYVMLVFGLNDFGHPNWSTSLYASKYTALINLVKAQGLVPVVVTSDPISTVNDVFVQNTLVPLQKQIALDNGVQCLDLNAGLVAWSDYRINQPDLIHFNNAGNAKKRDLAQAFMTALP